jgi:hypothetical protein
MINTKLQLKGEMKALEQQQSRKSNQQSKDKKSNKGESKGERKMPCHKHNGEHNYCNFLDNKNCRPQSKSKKEKEKSQKKDLHSTKRSDETAKTLIVKINKKPETRHMTDLDYSLDDGSAMMVQVSHNNKQVNGITVVEVPAKEGMLHMTTILIDNGFTG